MSEQERIELFDRIRQGIKKAHRQMLERKAALGQSIVIADAEGKPIVVPAAEVLERYKKQ